MPAAVLPVTSTSEMPSRLAVGSLTRPHVSRYDLIRVTWKSGVLLDKSRRYF